MPWLKHKEQQNAVEAQSISFHEKLLAYRANDSGYDKIITYDIQYRQFRKLG